MDKDVPQDASAPTLAPAEPASESIKRIGCTILTVLILLLLVCSLIYFFSGLAAMFVQLYETIVRDNPTLQ